MRSTVVNRDKAQSILRHIAQDTRQSLQELAESQGLTFDNSAYTDQQILDALMESTGMRRIFEAYDAGAELHKLSELLTEAG